MPVGVSAYVPLANMTVSVPATTVTFSSISQSFRDLVFVINYRSSTTTGLTARINSDSGTNYNSIDLRGSGASTSSTALSNQTSMQIGNAAPFSGPAIFNLNVLDYSTSNKHKNVLSRSGNANTGAGVDATASRWANTAAVTSMSFTLNGGLSFAVGDTLCLYGVSA